MKKIIVPIDFSEHSEFALEAAAKIAKREHAEILALHMLELSDALLTKSDNEQNANAVFFLKLAEKKFVDFLNKDYLKGIKVIPIVKHFKVFSEVSEVAKEHKADLIVMGSHGSSGFTEIFVGSNTEKVVRNSEIPVLVIKNRHENLAFNSAIFACDFSDSAIEPYRNAVRLLDAYNTSLQLLFVNVPGDGFRTSSQMEADVNAFLQKADGNLNKLNDVHFVSDKSVESGILNYANKINADLIVMPTHGRKGLAHFLEGSISEDLANHAKIPVMTFKMA